MIRYVLKLIILVTTLISGPAYAEDIECPKQVTGSDLQTASYSRTPTGPSVPFEINTVLVFPAKVITCTQLGKFLIATKIGPIWVSGGVFDHEGSMQGAGAIRGDENVSGASRGFAND